MASRCECALRLKRGHDDILALPLGSADAKQWRKKRVVHALEPARRCLRPRSPPPNYLIIALGGPLGKSSRGLRETFPLLTFGTVTATQPQFGAGRGNCRVCDLIAVLPGHSVRPPLNTHVPGQGVTVG
jgi:hypothetical protein